MIFEIFQELSVSLIHNSHSLLSLLRVFYLSKDRGPVLVGSIRLNYSFPFLFWLPHALQQPGRALSPIVLAKILPNLAKITYFYSPFSEKFIILPVQPLEIHPEWHRQLCFLLHVLVFL